MREKVSRFLEQKKIQKDQCLILLLAGVLLLVVVWPTDGSKKQGDAGGRDAAAVRQEAAESAGGEQQDYSAYWEDKLVSVLSGVPGAGEVKVAVHVSETEEQVTLKDYESGESRFSEATVYVTNEKGQKVPFVAKKRLPRVTGVVVAAQGAGQPPVEQDIRLAVRALFGIEDSRIMVLSLQ